MELEPLDPIHWLRERPGQFFVGGSVNPLDLAAWIMADVLLLSEQCVVRRFGDWWIVGSDVNWIQHPTHSVEDLFRHVVPDPRQGRHSMRAEVIVGAFASRVALVASGEERCIKGESPPASVWSNAKGLRAAILFAV
jgi:hypothetical protein